jgi:hypothetical protein
MIYMTENRWSRVPRDLTGRIDTRKTCVCPRGIDFVEIVRATDEHVDETGYGYYPEE